MMKDVFKNFVQEAEMFFVSKFISSEKLENEYSDCLDIIFNVTKTKDCGRGIIAFNQNYGQGKSFFFDVVNHRNKRVFGKDLFKRITAKELTQIYTSAKNGDDPQQKLIEAISVKKLFIDDIGDEGENKVFKHYANELNVLRFVLLKRYEMWLEKGWITYGTTNLTIKQFESNYDGRVADRVLQMCYWREFRFLAEGSFRQVEETRKLTIEEINQAWKKLEVEKPKEKIDLEKYFNELIDESDGYFQSKDISFWSFVKKYLLDKKLISQEELDKGINDELMYESQLTLRHERTESNRKKYKNATTDVRSARIQEALRNIKPKHILNVAENKIVREKFMELRNKKHKFE